MKYQAQPVVVDAYRILEVGEQLTEKRYLVLPDKWIPAGSLWLKLEENKAIWAMPEQLARMKPAAGDYVVVQSDGYTYLNPRDVFLRKYSPLCPGETCERWGQDHVHETR